MKALTYLTVARDSALQALGPYTANSSSTIAGRIVQTSYTISGTIAPQSNFSEAVLAPVAEDWMETAYATMLASEEVLAREWNTPEEDDAWGDL